LGAFSSVNWHRNGDDPNKFGTPVLRSGGPSHTKTFFNRVIETKWLSQVKIDFQEPLGFDTPFRGVYPERVEGLQGTQPALPPEHLPCPLGYKIHFQLVGYLGHVKASKPAFI
jgi:hypothetical protein